VPFQITTRRVARKFFLLRRLGLVSYLIEMKPVSRA
jgi:hypothetical protein